MKRILLLLIITMYSFISYSQTFTAPAIINSGEAVTIKGKDESQIGYFAVIYSYQIINNNPDGVTANADWGNSILYYNTVTMSPTSLKMTFTNKTSTVQHFALTFLCAVNNSLTSDQNRNYRTTLNFSLNPVQVQPTTYYNDHKSQVFYSTLCGTGYQAQPYTYTVLAGAYSSTISKADANAKAQNNINTNGQTAANSSGTCKQIYYNVLASANFTKTDCPVYATPGAPVSFTVPAGKYQSLISQADADGKALVDLNTNGPLNANATGTCIKREGVVVLRYINQSNTGSKITRLRIKNTSGAVVYDFNEAALIAGQDLIPGTYTYEITTQGGLPNTWNGWASVELRFTDPFASGDLFDNHGSNVYTTNAIQTTSSLLELFIYKDFA